MFHKLDSTHLPDVLVPLPLALPLHPQATWTGQLSLTVTDTWPNQPRKWKGSLRFTVGDHSPHGSGTKDSLDSHSWSPGHSSTSLHPHLIGSPTFQMYHSLGTKHPAHEPLGDITQTIVPPSFRHLIVIYNGIYYMWQGRLPSTSSWATYGHVLYLSGLHFSSV